MAFQRATKKQARLRMALIGPSGSGKTYTALSLATNLGERVAVIDTERGSASKYAHKFTFDVMELDNYHPQRYIDGIREAEVAGYDVLVIDSLSHAWMGRDGALELVDKAAKRQQSQNTFAAWREVTPLHNALVDAMLQCKMHIIVTMRAKTEYVLEVNEKGKQVPRKVGLAPVQRDGLEYEFDVVGDMDLDNNLIITKTRCEVLAGKVIDKPGAPLAQTLKEWLTDGVPAPAAQTQNPTSPLASALQDALGVGTQESQKKHPERNYRAFHAALREKGVTDQQYDAWKAEHGYQSSDDIPDDVWRAVSAVLRRGTPEQVQSYFATKEAASA